MTDALLGSLIGAALGTLIASLMFAIAGWRSGAKQRPDPDRWLADLNDKARRARKL